jgi:uncharacterized protein YceK
VGWDRRKIAGLLTAGLLTSALLSGCMTLDSRNDPDYEGSPIYSGTRLAVRHTGYALYRFNMLMFGYLADVPLSFVADTLLLPVTIREQAARQAEPAGAAASSFERQAPSLIGATAGGPPIPNAKRLFAACRVRCERLDPALADCYDVEARIVIETDAGRTELTGAEYKRRIHEALAGVDEALAFVSLRDPVYSEQRGLVRIEAERLASFGAERQHVTLVVGPGSDGGWRIVEEVSAGWP